MATTAASIGDQLGLSNDQLIELYRWMTLTREVDARIRALNLQGQVSGGVYSQLGHEATSVGSAYALRPSDVLAPMHRDLGAHLVRGMDIGQILAQIMGRDNVYTHGRDNALHIGSADLRVLPQISMLGVSIPVAVGAALSAVQRGEDDVALTYVGDGAVNTGDFHEGLNFAATLRLPFVLVVENNQYAYSTPLARQSALEHIVQRAAGYGVPGVRIDGNDVLAVYQATKQAVDRARQGGGPTLIECVTMRMRGHSESDNAAYVPPELLEQWRRRDPLERYERWLMNGSIMSSEQRDSVREDARLTVAQAAEWALQQPFPEMDENPEGVFKTRV